MTWSTIRRATTDDIEALESAAQRFCDRHEIDTDGFDSALSALDCETSSAGGCSLEIQERATHLQQLWVRIVRRTLDSPNAESIAYGYVGYHVE